MSGPSDDDPLEVDFTTFVLSMSTNCMMHLGELQPPGAEALSVDLPLAKHTIDILQMLEAKTRGNLTGEEDRILSQVLGDLREALARKLAAANER